MPSSDIGLIPIPTFLSNLIFFTLKSFFRVFTRSLEAEEFPSNSTPQYISSGFSLKITISVSCGLFTGDGTPLKYLIGLRQTYRSNICRSETLSDLIPPPTGVVNGPFMLITYSLRASIVSSGNQSSFEYTFVAFSPQ